MFDCLALSFRNRLAQTGELLVTYRFENGTIGFASADEVDALEANVDRKNPGFWSVVGGLFPKQENRPAPVTIVCIPPGSRLVVSQLPAGSTQSALFTPLDEMTFIELETSQQRYRGAFRLRSGGILLLQCVEEGVCFRVISTELREPEFYGPTVDVDQRIH